MAETMYFLVPWVKEISKMHTKLELNLKIIAIQSKQITKLWDLQWMTTVVIMKQFQTAKFVYAATNIKHCQGKQHQVGDCLTCKME